MKCYIGLCCINSVYFAYFIYFVCIRLHILLSLWQTRGLMGIFVCVCVSERVQLCQSILMLVIFTFGISSIVC